MFLGIFVFAIVVPIALFMRRRPEDYGMLPDGTKSGVGQRTAKSRRAIEQQRLDAANSYTRGESLRTRAIWLLIVGYALHTLAILAVLTPSLSRPTAVSHAPKQLWQSP